MTPLPVLVLTGFLGAGKTTLARRWLATPGVSLVVNEVGAVTVDEGIYADERLSMLPDGCACCATRQDLIDVVGALAQAPEPPELLILETSGLADAAPILATLLGHPELAGRVALQGVLTVVDAIRAPLHLREPEARNQVAFADAVLLSKVDRATPAQVAVAKDAIHNLRADLVPIEGNTAEVALASLAGAVDAATRPPWRFSLPATHEHDVVAHSLTGGVVAGAKLLAWLRGLTMVHGPSLMRIKGCVRVEGLDEPLRIQGVHDHLEANPAPEVATDGSVLVIIGRDLDAAALREGFAGCQASSA